MCVNTKQFMRMGLCKCRGSVAHLVAQPAIYMTSSFIKHPGESQMAFSSIEFSNHHSDSMPC